MKKKILVLDTYGLIYKTYYAFLNNPLMTSDGKNISSVYGVFNSIYTLIEKLKPDFIVAALDSIGKTFRHEQYSEYKANREKTPEDLHEQIPIIEELLKSMNISAIRVNGFEADDIIATIANKFDKSAYDLYIFSSDKDLLQLLTDSVFITKFDKLHQLEVITKSDVFDIWGVEPEKILDLLSLIGDTADNVRGVEGIGIKTAQKILTDYDDVDSLYANLETDTNLSTAIKNKLKNGFEDFKNAKSLITLRDDVKFDFDFVSKRLDYDELIDKLNIYKLPSLSKKFLKLSSKRKNSKVEVDESGEGDKTNEIALREKLKNGFESILGSFKFEPIKNFYSIKSAEDLEKILFSNLKSKYCAFFLNNDKFIEVSFSFDGNLIYGYKFLATDDSELFDDNEALKILSSFFEKSKSLFVMFDAKSILRIMKRLEIISNFNLNVFDVSLALWILQSNYSNYSIENILKVFNLKSIFDKETENKSSLTLEFVFKLFTTIQNFFENVELQKIYYDIELKLLPILCEMEETGIYLSVSELNDFSTYIESSIKEVENKIFKLAGHEFNILSPKQLQVVLYDERKLKPMKKIKTGFSTDDESLESLIEDDEIIIHILNYRKLTKLQSTYAVALPKLVDKNGFIHTTFLQTGTATGRLSSKDPNLQNIPIRDELGRKIRHAFYASGDNVLVSADYSQIELVVLAHLSNDKALCEAFSAGEDIHSKTASLIYGVDIEKVIPEMRRVAKVINFGVIYGMSAFRLANELKIPRSQAKMFIESYFQNYNGVQIYLESLKQKAIELGFVETILGRRRYIPEINSSNKVIKAAAERIAINSPIQGSASDIVKLAMIKIHERINQKKLSTKISLQVHDEVIFSTPESEVKIFSSILKDVFENVVKLSVPLRVNIEVGKSWGEFH